MGKIIVKAKLTNFMDVVAVKLGVKKPEQIRSVQVDALIDTGATPVVLPEAIADQLGLETVKVTKVRYADGREAERREVRALMVEIMGRDTETTRTIVEPNAPQVLIGQIVLEALDLHVDPKAGTIGPRPESPDAPIYDVF